MKAKKISGKQKLVDEIYEWISKGVPVPPEKARLLTMMIEATLDYLYLKKLIFERTEKGKEN